MFFVIVNTLYVNSGCIMLLNGTPYLLVGLPNKLMKKKRLIFKTSYYSRISEKFKINFNLVLIKFYFAFEIVFIFKLLWTTLNKQFIKCIRPPEKK